MRVNFYRSRQREKRWGATGASPRHCSLRVSMLRVDCGAERFNAVERRDDEFFWQGQHVDMTVGVSDLYRAPNDRVIVRQVCVRPATQGMRDRRAEEARRLCELLYLLLELAKQGIRLEEYLVHKSVGGS